MGCSIALQQGCSPQAAEARAMAQWLGARAVSDQLCGDNAGQLHPARRIAWSASKDQATFPLSFRRTSSRWHHSAILIQSSGVPSLFILFARQLMTCILSLTYPFEG